LWFLKKEKKPLIEWWMRKIEEEKRLIYGWRVEEDG